MVTDEDFEYMLIKQFYSKRLQCKIITRLSCRVAELCPAKTFCPVISIHGPKALSERFLKQWLFFNYLHAFECMPGYSPVFGALRGIMPPHPTDSSGKYVLAVAQSDIEQVAAEFSCIRKLRKKQARGSGPVEEASTEIEMVPVNKSSESQLEYDFTTTVFGPDPSEDLLPDAQIIRSLRSRKSFKKRCFDRDSYIFNIPLNTKLLAALADADTRNVKTKSSILRDAPNIIPADDCIYGFHFSYTGQKINLRPLFAENHVNLNLVWLETNGYVASVSDIGYVGIMNPETDYWIIKH